jgi:type IX secretion system PorP/SprF family membrane protein
MIKNVSKSIAIALGLFVADVGVTYGQQEIQNSFYMFNGSLFNPAYSGSRDALSAVANYRNQWSGWAGAPVSRILTVHSPLMNDKLGVGLNVTNEEIGATKKSAIFGDFAYRLPMNNNKDRLCFGIRAGIDIIRNNFSSLTINESQDPFVANNSDFNRNPLNIGAGVYYYGSRYFIGLTAPKMIPNKLSKDPNLAASTQKLHTYLIAGYVFKLNSLWDLKPTAAVKFTPNAPLSYDANVSVLFHKLIWFGLMYRGGAAAGANIVYNITPQLYVGYAYDFTLTNMGAYNPSTHEIMVGFDFIRNSKAVKSPRYF